MTLPDDREARLRCYRNALRNWNYEGYVTFKPIAEKWLANEFPDMALRQIAHELHRYVEEGGEPREKKERRLEWIHDEYYYEIRMKIGDRRIYFEMVLRVLKDPDDPDDPTIRVVSVRDV